MTRLLCKRAQSTLELAILAAVIVAALMTIGTYTKRAVQGRMRTGAEAIAIPQQ